jgi:nitroimidazol reductase NimA-like FMN-containing flavoprotein (pyridoxamine 5'-phosphate oxidase superfamily)
MTVTALRDEGVTEMDDAEIKSFLSSQSQGVLGLPTADAPYLLPMSYGFDGASAMYLTVVGGPESRKRALLERTGRARFLVHSAETPFNWGSVQLAGPVEAVPQGEWEQFAAVEASPWRPAVVEAAMESTDVTVYRLRAETWTGIRHTGLPSGFEGDGTG